MTPEEIVKVLREVDAEAKANEGDYYADQFAWHGAGEIADAVEQIAAEIARLREEQKPVAWCVQAAAGSMVDARTHTPIDAAVLIQCKDEAYARMMATVYGHKILLVVEPRGKEVGRE